MQSGATKLELLRLSAQVVAGVRADQGRAVSDPGAAFGIHEAPWQLDMLLPRSSSSAPATMTTSSAWIRRAVEASTIAAVLMIFGLLAPLTECLAAEPKAGQTFEVLAIQTGSTTVDPRVIAKHFDDACEEYDGAELAGCKKVLARARASLNGKGMLLRNIHAGMAPFDTKKQLQYFGFDYIILGDVESMKGDDAVPDFFVTLGTLLKPFFMSPDSYARDPGKSVAQHGQCAVSFTSVDEAEAWRRKHSHDLRAEVLVKGSRPFSEAGGRVKGYALQPVGVRVYDSVTSEILCSNPPSAARLVTESWGNYGTGRAEAYTPSPTGPSGFVRLVLPDAGLPGVGLLVDGKLAMPAKRMDRIQGHAPGTPELFINVSVGSHLLEVVEMRQQKGILRVATVRAETENGRELELDAVKLYPLSIAAPREWSSGSLDEAYAAGAQHLEGTQRLVKAQDLVAKMRFQEARPILETLLSDFPSQDDRLHQEAARELEKVTGRGQRSQ